MIPVPPKEAIKDKEVVVPLERFLLPDGTPAFRCPRCHRLFKYGIVKIQYCNECGQHIAPLITLETENGIKEQFLKTVKLEELEKEK